MREAKETIAALAEYNSWRRGDETIEQPEPSEIGAAIDDAVNLLRRYDELQRERDRLRAALEEIQHAGSAEWARKRAERALDGKPR